MSRNLNFSVSKGIITDDAGNVITTLAFAGNDSRPGVNPNHIHGYNNVAMESIHFIGPLPRGLYRVGIWGDHPPVGPNSAPLIWIGGPNDFGRSDFFIHGPATYDVLNSSEGCIVVPHFDRLKIIVLNPSTITVTD